MDQTIDKTTEQPPKADSTEREPNTREQRIKELMEQLRKAEARAEEEKERYLRITAEVDARRKRIADEAESRIASFQLESVRGFLRAADNLERALQASPGEEGFATLREGIEMTLKQFYAELEKQGLQRIDCLGQLFDPRLHEAIAVRHEPDRAENEIIEVHQHGFQLGERLVRPA